MDRHDFIFGLGGCVAASALNGCRWLAKDCEEPRLRLGMAGWTLNHLKASEALAFCERHGFRNLCVKDFHLPYDASAAKIGEFLDMCADHGVSPYAAGPIEFSTIDEARRAFDFVAALGVGTMAAVPWQPDAQGRRAWKHVCSNVAICEKVAELADAYKINFAIHNHGSKVETGVPTLWPTPDVIMQTLGPLGPRMGLCLDVAFAKIDGYDVPALISRFGSRIFDVHVRCLSDATNGASACNPARRAFDYDEIVAALRDVGYRGCLGLELSNDNPKALSWPEWERWIDESRDYFENMI